MELFWSLCTPICPNLQRTNFTTYKHWRKFYRRQLLNKKLHYRTSVVCTFSADFCHLSAHQFFRLPIPLQACLLIMSAWLHPPSICALWCSFNQTILFPTTKRIWLLNMPATLDFFPALRHARASVFFFPMLSPPAPSPLSSLLYASKNSVAVILPGQT